MAYSANRRVSTVRAPADRDQPVPLPVRHGNVPPAESLLASPDTGSGPGTLAPDHGCGQRLGFGLRGIRPCREAGRRPVFPQKGRHERDNRRASADQGLPAG